MENLYRVYCLQSMVNLRKTYIGCTNNFERRLRQHNGEISGGARATRAHRPWKHLFCITGLTRTQALQLEWAIKHRRVKGVAGPRGRIRTAENMLAEPNRWTSRAPPMDSIRGKLQVLASISRDDYHNLAYPTTIARGVADRHFNVGPLPG